MSQPAANHRVLALEHTLDAVLIVRESGAFSLTQAGEDLYTLAAPLVEAIEALVTDFPEHIEKEAGGRVEVAATVEGATGAVIRRVKRFRDQYPGVRVRVRTRPLHDAVALVRNAEVDIALGMRAPLEDTSIAYQEMFTCETVLITALEHPLAGRASVTPEEASEWPAIVSPAGAFGHTIEADLNATIRMEGWDAIKSVVAMGIGIAMAPTQCLHERDQVAVIPLKACPPRSFGAYTRANRRLTGPTRRFLEALLT